jgi:hypothetical protein
MYISVYLFIILFGTVCVIFFTKRETLKTNKKMKTKINISNLKKIGITFAAAMTLTTAALAGSNSANNEKMASSGRLEALMSATEKSIRFVAPAIEESQDVYNALEELNALAETTEASVKYVAPEAEEEAVAPEVESLNALAEILEANIKYVAPAVDENQEVASAMEGLDNLAAATEAAVAFRAPRVADSSENAAEGNSITGLILADGTK